MRYDILYNIFDVTEYIIKLPANVYAQYAKSQQHLTVQSGSCEH